MSLELNGIITIDKLARYNQKIAEKYALITELEEALKQINLADYYTKKQVDEIIGTIEGTEEQVIVTAMTSEDILAAIGMAGESVPVNPSGQILTEMSAEDVNNIIKG